MDIQRRGNENGCGDRGMREYNRPWKITDSRPRMS